MSILNMFHARWIVQEMIYRFRISVLPNIQVDFGVEVHEKYRWNKSEDDGLAPIHVGGIVRVNS